MDKQQRMAILKALADETRMQIFDILRSGTKCACKILDSLNITQPTLSHHMKILCDCGIVKSERVGKWSHYTLVCSKLKELLDFLSDTSCSKNYNQTKKENICDCDD